MERPGSMYDVTHAVKNRVVIWWIESKTRSVYKAPLDRNSCWAMETYRFPACYFALSMFLTRDTNLEASRERH